MPPVTSRQQQQRGLTSAAAADQGPGAAAEGEGPRELDLKAARRRAEVDERLCPVAPPRENEDGEPRRATAGAGH